MNSPSFRLSVFAKHSHLGITGYQDPHPEALSRKTSAAMLSPLQDFHPTPRPGQRFMPGGLKGGPWGPLKKTKIDII
jgi:hypothetical protein